MLTSPRALLLFCFGFVHLQLDFSHSQPSTRLPHSKLVFTEIEVVGTYHAAVPEVTWY